MAYLALNDGFASAIAAASPKPFAPALPAAAPKADIPAGFSALEWSGVLIARHEQPSSQSEPGRLQKIHRRAGHLDSEF